MKECFQYAAPLPDSAAPLWLCLAGITYPDPHYKIIRKSADIYVAEYVTAGAGTVIADGVEHHVTPGTVYLLQAGRRHHYYASRQDPWTKMWLNISGPLCGELLRLYGIEGQTCFKAPEAEPLFRDFLAFCETSPDPAAANREAAVFLLRLAECLARSTAHTEQDTLPEKVCRYIDTHIRERLSASELAKQSGISVSYLGRLFKQRYGQAVYAYILDRKIEAAKHLLADTRLPVREISEYLSFTDEHYFSHIFKKKQQQTPLAYRKSMRSKTQRRTG